MDNVIHLISDPVQIGSEILYKHLVRLQNCKAVKTTQNRNVNFFGNVSIFRTIERQ